MKKLILIRHGAAEPETSNKSDFDRNLTDNGKKDAAKMAALLLNKVSRPEIFVCSPAFRAQNTAQIFAATFGFDNVYPDAAIYEASAQTLMQIVHLLSNNQAVACLVGHNPGISNLLYILTGEIITIPTSAWVEVELDVENWAEASTESGKLLQYQYP